MGSPPRPGSQMFDGDSNAAAYYLPENAGWGTNYGGLPTALWTPQMETAGGRFGVQTNQFGFDLTWASSRIVVVEACTNLGNPVWLPLRTNTLINGTSYFTDPQWTNSPARFYRIRSP